MTRFVSSLLILFSIVCPAAAVPNVVASIKPVHALTAGVMADIGSPVLLLDTQDSPHHATLKPSQARALQNADLVFWVGEELETFLQGPVTTLSSKAQVVTLIDLPKLHFPEPEHIGDGHDGHNHHDHDPHIWLDPENAMVMIDAIVAHLSALDTENSTHYLANGTRMISAIKDQQSKLQEQLQPYSKARYLTFHNAYGHFEYRFNLTGGSTITSNAESRVGARRVSALKSEIENHKISCVFSEPEFNSNTVGLLIEGTNAKTALIDPLGTQLPPGSNLYAELLENLTTTFTGCFK